MPTLRHAAGKDKCKYSRSKRKEGENLKKSVIALRNKLQEHRAVADRTAVKQADQHEAALRNQDPRIPPGGESCARQPARSCEEDRSAEQLSWLPVGTRGGDVRRARA